MKNQINFYALNMDERQNIICRHKTYNTWLEFRYFAPSLIKKMSFTKGWLFGGNSLLNFRIWLSKYEKGSKPLTYPYSQFAYKNGVKSDDLSFAEQEIYEYDAFENNIVFLLGEGFDPSDNKFIQKIIQNTGVNLNDEN